MKVCHRHTFGWAGVAGFWEKGRGGFSRAFPKPGRGCEGERGFKRAVQWWGGGFWGLVRDGKRERSVGGGGAGGAGDHAAGERGAF